MFRVVVAGHGGYTNVADRLWLTSASSTEEEVGDLFGTRCPLSAAPAPAEHDIPVSSRALRQCTPSRLSGVSPSVMSQWLADGGWPGDWAVGGLVDGHGIVLGQVVPGFPGLRWLARGSFRRSTRTLRPMARTSR